MQGLTPEEEQELQTFLGQLARAVSHRECYHCGKVGELEEIGRCVYCMSCRQRLYQGCLGGEASAKEEEGK